MVSDIVGSGLLNELQQVQRPSNARTETTTRQVQGRPFESILKEEMSESAPLRFSAHAQQRLEARGIELSDSDLDRLRDAVNQADAKGSRESLVLMDDLAAIVSVRNRTVVTVMDAKSSKEGVFTNIDSAIVLTR